MLRTVKMCLIVDFIFPVRYMTWDKHKFPNPVAMQDNIASKGRKVSVRP